MFVRSAATMRSLHAYRDRLRAAKLQFFRECAMESRWVLARESLLYWLRQNSGVLLVFALACLTRSCGRCG